MCDTVSKMKAYSGLIFVISCIEHPEAVGHHNREIDEESSEWCEARHVSRLCHEGHQAGENQ